MLRLIGLSGLFLLVACSNTTFVDKIYQQSHNGPTLQVPATLSKDALNHYDHYPHRPHRQRWILCRSFRRLFKVELNKNGFCTNLMSGFKQTKKEIVMRKLIRNSCTPRELEFIRGLYSSNGHKCRKSRCRCWLCSR